MARSHRTSLARRPVVRAGRWIAAACLAALLPLAGCAANPVTRDPAALSRDLAMTCWQVSGPGLARDEFWNGPVQLDTAAPRRQSARGRGRALRPLTENLPVNDTMDVTSWWEAADHDHAEMVLLALMIGLKVRVQVRGDQMRGWSQAFTDVIEENKRIPRYPVTGRRVACPAPGGDEAAVMHDSTALSRGLAMTCWRLSGPAFDGDPYWRAAVRFDTARDPSRTPSARLHPLVRLGVAPRGDPEMVNSWRAAGPDSLEIWRGTPFYGTYIGVRARGDSLFGSARPYADVVTPGRPVPGFPVSGVRVPCAALAGARGEPGDGAAVLETDR